MAYRTRQQHSSTTTKQLSRHNNKKIERNTAISSSLIAKAISASSANKDASLSSSGVYSTSFSSSKDAGGGGKSEEDVRHGLWGFLARNVRAILDDDEGGGDGSGRRDERVGDARAEVGRLGTGDDEYSSHDNRQSTDRPALQKGFNALTSSINYIGNAVEGGLNIIENRTAGLLKETRKHIQKRPGTFDKNQSTDGSGTRQQPQMKTQSPPQTQADYELQLKASRDVAMAMAAKAKLLLRESKTVKVDLAFAKERCAQLEEENKIFRENLDRGDHPENYEMIQLQLETLLAEKAGLAHENSDYTRENRFLREIVEYHQLTMQDVVYLDENTEEVSQVYPIKGPLSSNIQTRPNPSHMRTPD